MATIQVPAVWMAQNYLPPVCARHGQQATRLVARRFYTRTPGWTYVLILIGLLIFAIVALSIRRTVATSLPACGECTRDRRQFIALVVSGWFAVLSIMVVAATFSSPVIFLLGLVAVLAAVVFSFAGDYFRVAGSLNDDRVWVTLRRVDESFAAAIANALRPAPQVAAPAVAYHANQNILPSQ